MPGRRAGAAKPRTTLSTPRTMKAIPISSASVFEAHVRQREDQPAEHDVDDRGEQPEAAVARVRDGAHEVDDAGDDEPDAEHDQHREQALAGPPHHDEAGHDPEQPEHRGEDARGGVAVVAERVDEAEGAEQQQVDAGDQREREQRHVREDEGEDAGDRAEHAGDDQQRARAAAGRRGPRARTGVVVVMARWLTARAGERGVTPPG